MAQFKENLAGRSQLIRIQDGENHCMKPYESAAFRHFFYWSDTIAMKKNKKKKTGNLNPMRCPYCGASVVFRSAEGIYRENSADTMLYVCSNYPECDAYVRVQKGTKKPVGTMADHKLRALRTEAHRHFDKLYKSGIMSKEEAYFWLANLISAPLSEAHIGYLGEYYCSMVIEESKKLFERKTASMRNKRKGDCA